MPFLCKVGKFCSFTMTDYKEKPMAKNNDQIYQGVRNPNTGKFEYVPCDPTEVIANPPHFFQKGSSKGGVFRWIPLQFDETYSSERTCPNELIEILQEVFETYKYCPNAESLHEVIAQEKHLRQFFTHIVNYRYEEAQFLLRDILYCLIGTAFDLDTQHKNALNATDGLASSIENLHNTLHELPEDVQNVLKNKAQDYKKLHDCMNKIEETLKDIEVLSELKEDYVSQSNETNSPNSEHTDPMQAIFGPDGLVYRINQKKITYQEVIEFRATYENILLGLKTPATQIVDTESPLMPEYKEYKGKITSLLSMYRELSKNILKYEKSRKNTGAYPFVNSDELKSVISEENYNKIYKCLSTYLNYLENVERKVQRLERTFYDAHSTATPLSPEADNTLIQSYTQAIEMIDKLLKQHFDHSTKDSEVTENKPVQQKPECRQVPQAPSTDRPEVLSNDQQEQLQIEEFLKQKKQMDNPRLPSTSDSNTHKRKDVHEQSRPLELLNELKKNPDLVQFLENHEPISDLSKQDDIIQLLYVFGYYSSKIVPLLSAITIKAMIRTLIFSGFYDESDKKELDESLKQFIDTYSHSYKSDTTYVTQTCRYEGTGLHWIEFFVRRSGIQKRLKLTLNGRKFVEDSGVLERYPLINKEWIDEQKKLMDIQFEEERKKKKQK